VRNSYRARRLALQALFCLDAQGNKVWNLIEEFIADSDETPETIAAAKKLMRETFDSLDECDKILARHARHWDLSRLAMVDRSILRLAVMELLEGTTPFKVVITEAMRLAKEFSSAESPRFVNGVLDAVAKEVRQEAQGEQPAGPVDEAEDETDTDAK
jgi:N utilization substance protein B